MGGQTVPQPPPLTSEATRPATSSRDDHSPPSFEALPDYPDLKSLPDIVQPETLTEAAAGGSRLPIVDAQGRRPWQVYSRPFPGAHDAVPIAVVVRNLGLNRKATEAAIRKLPPDVTLSFSFGSLFLDNDLQKARAAGHETLLELPLEPTNYPVSDPGPDTLLTTLPFDINEKRLNLTLGRGVGYVGVMAASATRYSESPQMNELLDVLHRRGLLFVGNLGGASIPQGMPTAGILQEVDQNPLRTAIDAALTQVMETVETTGQRSVITLSATPVALERLLHWTRLIENNPRIVIAPVSAIVRSPPDAPAELTPQDTPTGVATPAAP